MMGPFVSEQERQMVGSIQGMDGGTAHTILANISDMRAAMVSSDAWRSVIIILIGFALLFAYKLKKLRADYMIAALLVLCLVDMWQVDKRYLNDEMFVPKSERDMPQQPTATDIEINKDKSLDYRVLNFASNTFNENETSYFHKSIGGYHPAKLRRYQEMVDAYIVPEMQKAMQAIAAKGGNMQQVDGVKLFPVLNMLNTKYFIFPLQGGATIPLKNIYAQGNGWFVDKIDYVADANAEYAEVGKIDVRHEAVADKQFETTLKASNAQGNVSQVELVSYTPNKLKYNVSSEKGGVVVFSEIYYPGWTATIDGQKADLGRVNYILRALNVEKGKHTIELTFDPQSVHTTETIATVSFAVLLILIALIAFLEYKKRKNSNITK